MVMHHPVIHKPGSFPVPPNIPDHEAMRRTFGWEEIERELDWLPGGGLNVAYEAIDRHCAHGRADKPAMLWEGKGGETEQYTYDDMRRQTNRFANVLAGLGVARRSCGVQPGLVERASTDGRTRNESRLRAELALQVAVKCAHDSVSLPAEVWRAVTGPPRIVHR